MSTIKLYRNCKITEEKNFQVDQIYDYLGSFSGGDVKVFNNCQYIKQGLDAEVKVTLDQTYLDKQWTNMFNYCSIEMDNDGGLDNTYYYFIREKKWISKDAIRLVLRLDVLNTFNGQYKLTNKTTIQREHKDRFVKEEDYSEVIRTYLNSEDWSWNLTPATTAQRKGNATFKLPDTFKYRKVKVVIELISGTGADFYFDYWDGETCELTIEAIKLGYPRPSIPTGEIRILVETKVSDELIRKIDKVSEGINPVLWNKNKDELLKEEINLMNDEKIYMGDSTWYITYKTATAYNSDKPDDFIYNNAINTFVTADTYDLTVPVSSNTEIAVDTLINDISATDWHNGVVICFPVGADGKHMPNSFPEFQESVLSKTPKEILIDLIDSNNNVVNTFKIFTEYVSKTNHSRLKQHCMILQETLAHEKWLSIGVLKRDNFYNDTASKLHEIDLLNYSGYKLKFNNVSSVNIFTTTSFIKPIGMVDNFYDAFVRNPGPSVYNYSGGRPVYKELKNFNLTNRSEQTLVKIINIPYSPVDILNNQLVYDNNEHQLSLNKAAFRYDPSFNHMIKLNVDPLDIYSTGDAETYTPISDMYIKVNADIEALRNDIYESKLYHSDFSQVKFVYDSFSYVFRNELLDINAMKMLSEAELVGDDYIYVDYDVSNSVSSAFGFNFNTCYPLAAQYEDYNVMVVNRNLEMPIYNNYYLNYLRSGALSADKKANQAKDIATGIGTGVGIASTIAGIALSATGYGATFGAPMIVGGVATTATSLTGAISSSIQADRALQQKLEQAKNQSASVQGSDDIGLLRWYTPSNLCKLVRYGLSDTSKDRIADLFYYCGYKCDYQDVPDTTSRYWFNFIQCDPVFDVDRYTVKMGKDCLDELTNKYKAGVTVLHRNNGMYDFNQEKENWETWLIQ